MFKFSLNSSFNDLAQILEQKMLLIEETREQIAQDLKVKMKQEIKDILNIPVGKNGAKIVRSLPLEAPRKQSGTLQNSVDSLIEKQGSAIKVKVFCSDIAPYALYLEYGTTKTAPRPFMLPTLSKYALILKEDIGGLQKLL